MSSFVRSFYTLNSEFLSSLIVVSNLSKILPSRFYKFPHFIETTTFGISCDAFANLKETLTRHKPMVADYLDKNYDRASDTHPFLTFMPSHFSFFCSNY